MEKSPCQPPAIRRLRAGDASALCRFYNGLSRESLRTFRPLGPQTTLDACQEVVSANEPEGEAKFDLVAWQGRVIVGWGFLWNLDSPEAMFGLAVADDYQGRGIGSAVAREVMAEARDRALPRVVLTVVKDNLKARRIYERLSFVVSGEFVHEEDGLVYLRMAAGPAHDES